MRASLLCGVLALLPVGLQAQGLRLALGADSGSVLHVSGQGRLRAESWNAFGFGAPPGADHHDAFVLSRVLLKADARWRGRVGLVAELKSSLAASRDLPGGRRTADEDVIDVQQLYGEGVISSDGPLRSVRAGRFELALGRERLVSPLDWTNTRRTFQGGALRGAWRGVSAQAFWVEPVTIRRRKPNVADSTRQLYGVHLSRGAPRLMQELYWLRHEADLASFNGTAGVERRHTYGARLSRQPAARQFDFDAEAAWQSGTLDGVDVGAFMVALQAGRSLAGRWSPRIYAGLDVASGDRTAGGNVRTFHQLYPLGHAFLGYADVHGRQNIVALSAGASARPARDLTVQLDVHDFTRQSRGDGLYGVDGSLARGPGAGLPMRVGTEVDLTVRRPVAGRRLMLQGGLSRYLAGAFLEQSGPARDLTWSYLQGTWAF